MKPITHILSFLLALFVLSGSIGMDVYRSYCNMRGESRTFFTSGNDLCEILTESPTKSCCSAISLTCGLDDEDDGCCHEDEFTFSIEPEFSESIDGFSFHIKTLPAVANLIQSQSILWIPQLTYHKKFNRPPPLAPYGRELLSRIAVLRI